MEDSPLFGRFSCRRFSPRSLTESEIDRLLDAATWAPSAGNLQPWRFVVVSDEALRRAVAATTAGQVFIATAPVVIVVCAVAAESARIYASRGVSLYCLQDTAAATQNILLAATEMGLGACWVGAFDETALATALGLADGWRPVAMVPVGEPAELPGRRQRRPRSDVVVRR